MSELKMCVLLKAAMVHCLKEGCYPNYEIMLVVLIAGFTCYMDIQVRTVQCTLPFNKQLSRIFFLPRILKVILG